MATDTHFSATSWRSISVISIALELVAVKQIPATVCRVTVFSPELVARFQPGDHLLVEHFSGELLLIPVGDE